MVWLMGAFMLAIAASTAVILQVQVMSTARITTVVAPAYDQNRQALQAMTDAETGLRGFQVSGGERSLLEPYDSGQQRTFSALRTVRTLLARAEQGRPDRERVLAAQAVQEQAARDWWAYARASVDRYRPGADPEVDLGKPLFDSFRTANAAVGHRLQAERDAGRRATVDNLNLDTWVVLLATVIAMVMAGLVGRRMSRALTGPLADLHRVVTRQHQGERDLRAREDQQITEIRDLAADFNRLSDSNEQLNLEQAQGLMMHQLTLDVERSLRRAPDVQGALDVLCAALGEGLGVDRVMANTVDAQHRVQRGAQWHGGGLAPLGDVPEDLAPHVGRLGEQLWSTAGRLAIRDFQDPEVQSQERARLFARETGARSVIMVPIGLGERMLGIIFVLTVHEMRAWTRAEANAVQQVAAFAARVLVQAEHEANQQDHVARLERLDRQKTDFLSTVSHELRTPLTSISGYLELLQDGDAGDADRGAALDAGRDRAQQHPAAGADRGPARAQPDRVRRPARRPARRVAGRAGAAHGRGAGPARPPGRGRRRGPGLRGGAWSSPGTRATCTGRSSTCCPTRSSSPPPAVGSSSPSRSCPRAPTARVRGCGCAAATPGSGSPRPTCRSCSRASTAPATRPAPPYRARASAWPSSRRSWRTTAATSTCRRWRGRAPSW